MAHLSSDPVDEAINDVHPRLGSQEQAVLTEADTTERVSLADELALDLGTEQVGGREQIEVDAENRADWASD